MPKLEEVRWHRAQGSATQEDRTTNGNIMIHLGDWEKIQCRITPNHRAPGMYRAHVTSGEPWGYQEAQNLTAQEALDWCLETMERLVRNRDERKHAHQVLRDFEDRNGRDSSKAMDQLLGLESTE